jgi:hypothetical protein
MFAFFKSGQIQGQWGNKVGDVFYMLTCESLGWNPSEVKLVYYPVPKNQQGQTLEISESSCVVKDSGGATIASYAGVVYADAGTIIEVC